MSDTTITLTPPLYHYLLEKSLREPPILTELRKETRKAFSVQMQISPEQGQFMRLLVEILQAKKTLDIGVFTGYSSLSVALALPEDGIVIACDKSIEWTNMAREFWRKASVSHKIDLRIAPALETLDKLLADGEANTFDFSFIDADKQNYLAYYEKSLALIRTGGLIAIDNVLWGGSVADANDKEASTRAIRAFNDFVMKDERVSISMIAIGDGLTLARKK